MGFFTIYMGIEGGGGAAPVPPEGEQIIKIARFQTPTGDLILMQLADGRLLRGVGYGIPVALTPSSTQIIKVYRFETELGTRIFYQLGDGTVVEARGLDT